MLHITLAVSPVTPVSLTPHFNFYFLDVEQKLLPTGCYDGNSPLSLMFSQPDQKLSVDFFEMWSIKRDNWKNGQEEVDFATQVLRPCRNFSLLEPPDCI
jgi:hypothetical protein